MVVLYEDQQKINLFAKKNSQKNDIIERMREKEVSPTASHGLINILIIATLKFEDKNLIWCPFSL